MSIRKISFGFVLGILSRAVDGIVGLVLFPVLLKFMSKDTVGIWILFMSFSYVINLAQAGLGPVIVRLAAEAKANFDFSQTNLLYNTVTRGYLLVVLVVIIITFAIYVFYVGPVLSHHNLSEAGTLSWIMVSMGYILRIYATRNINMINGCGELGWDKLLQIIVTIFSIVFFYIMLQCGFGLTGLGMVFFIASIIYSFGAGTAQQYFVKSSVNWSDQSIKWQSIQVLFKQSAPLLIVNVSAFLVMNTDVFIIERLFGLSVLPFYSALSKVVILIITVSTLIQQMTYPYVAMYWTQHKHELCASIYIKSVLTSVGIGLILSLGAYFLAPFIVPLWLGSGNYLGGHIFGLQLLFGLIYIHHSAHASSVIATGANNFMIPAVINALLSVPLSYLLGKYMGIHGVVLGNILATLVPSIYVVWWSVHFFRLNGSHDCL